MFEMQELMVVIPARETAGHSPAEKDRPAGHTGRKI